MVVFALAWIRGGHPERFGVLLVMIAYLVAITAPRITVFGDLLIVDAVADTTLFLLFSGMALRGDRWWPFLASAVMFLTVLVHLAMIFIPELDTRADMSARLGLTLLVVVALLVGVGERWLAGEMAACQPSTWKRRRPPAEKASA